jgi:hypothetical protein
MVATARTAVIVRAAKSRKSYGIKLPPAMLIDVDDDVIE